MSKKNDRTLRILHEVFELDRLHYGMWQKNDELTFDNLKLAQKRYESNIIEQIPKNVKTILDVGCGTGVMTKNLLKLGYDVHGLSPDINQKELFTRELDTIFHHTSFENFDEKNKYDCLIMSESSQYIKLNKLFVVAKQALHKNGYLLVCDYFVRNDVKGFHSKSGHNFDSFMEQASLNGFKLISEQNITKDVLKTLDIGKELAEKAILTVNIGTEKTRIKHPYLSKFVLWLFRNKIEYNKKQLELLDSEKFIKNKTYRFLLFQLNRKK